MPYSDQHSGPYPLREMRDPRESQHPPPVEDDHARAYHQQVPYSNVTLPQQVVYRRDNRGGYPVVYSRSTPQHIAFNQSAPRQRTPIACKHCRRRKIRCFGFEQNAQGRCSNCQRFKQDCIFTPVSSKAQVFVLAHVSYPHMRNMAAGPDGHACMMYPKPQQLYGAHGQPLGQIPMPSPTGSYSSFTDDRAEPSRKRLRAEPHASILPPPVPGQPSYPRSEGPRRQAVEDDFRLLPVTPTTGSSQVSWNYLPGPSTSSNSGLRLSQGSGLPSLDSGLPTLNSGLPSLSRTPPLKSSPDDLADPMSLSNIVESRPNTNIDRNMLSRLDRKRQ